jgi:hypothetical protein
MADFAFVIVIIAFFALAAAFVYGCDHIVRSDDDDHHAPTEITEVTS